MSRSEFVSMPFGRVDPGLLTTSPAVESWTSARIVFDELVWRGRVAELRTAAERIGVAALRDAAVASATRRRRVQAARERAADYAAEPIPSKVVFQFIDVDGFVAELADLLGVRLEQISTTSILRLDISSAA